MRLTDALRSISEKDANRDSLPGEHWATFGTSLAVLGWAMRTRSPLLRTLALAVGSLMFVRALSGREGPLARLRRDH